MNQHHDERNGWVEDAERWICQLQGVRQCKIDLDAGGNVSGIHVVATDERDPRHVVRDVEGLLKARLNLDVYYKKIGVVQVIDPGDETDADASSAPSPEAEAAADETEATVRNGRPAPSPEPLPFPFGDGVQPALLVEEPPLARVECSGLGLMVSGATLSATVELVRAEAAAQGRAHGPNHPGMDLQILARAAVQAVEELLDDPVSLSLADVREQEAAGEPLLVVAVDLVEGRRSERFFGLCRARPNPQQAAVYAVLDALNRRLELMDTKEDQAVSND